MLGFMCCLGKNYSNKTLYMLRKSAKSMEDLLENKSSIVWQ